MLRAAAQGVQQLWELPNPYAPARTAAADAQPGPWRGPEPAANGAGPPQTPGDPPVQVTDPTPRFALAPVAPTPRTAVLPWLMARGFATLLGLLQSGV